MARKLKPAGFMEACALDCAEDRLRAALASAKRADCPKLADKIRRALKSAGGARRHMARRRVATMQGRV